MKQIIGFKYRMKLHTNMIETMNIIQINLSCVDVNCNTLWSQNK